MGDIVFWGIIIANIIISYKGFKDINFFRKNDFHVGSIQMGERHRMFTSGFLHVDVTHLLFNMLTFYFFAPIVMRTMGEISFVFIYVASLFFGNFLTMYFHKYDFNYRAVGASGAVMGVVYSSILFYPEAKLYLFFALPIPAYLFGIGYLFYSIYGMKSQNSNIGHTAHLGGAVAGFILSIVLYPELLVAHTSTVLLLLLPIVYLFYTLKRNK